MFRANNFDKLLDKATSNLRLDPDWPTILQICDLIRQNDCTPKYAIAGLKKKLYSQNPHQAMFALLTLESIVKNCGSGMHDEVASKAFCEMLRDLVKTTQHENLRNKILELIQAWAFAFRNTPKYRAVQDTVNILKAECYKFPTLKESDAMFSADTAPEWADGEVCHRCRVAFSLMVRRHHCRACGQVFCQQCSSKTSTLPKFGIEKDVRVCDACYDKVSRPPTSTAKLEIVDTSNDYGPTQPQKRPPGGKTAEELQEEEELQLALALSQSEAEQKEKERRSRSHINPNPTSLHPTVSPTPSSVSASPEHSTAANAELSRYLDRGYWEQRLSRDTASAPAAPASIASSEPSQFPEQDYAKPATNKTNEEDAEDKEIEEFCSTLKSQVEIFVNRMKSNSSRGRSIANDTSVQTLFMNITAMHSNLLRYIQMQDDKRVYLESLQDKVTQIRDSRAALDTLRAEHAARLAAAAEAAERQRQMQMAAKLQAMRKKKHEYLQYQRQLALQRVQEQEREMQMRQEQQKHQYMMSSAGGYYMPGVSMQQYQPGFNNQPIYANPQQYHQMMPQVTTDGLPGQPQISQPMPGNPMATTAQSMSTMSQGYPLPASSTAAISQANMNSQNMPGNVRQQLTQQMPMMMQQMHQMRLPSQTAQLGQNGYAGQNIPQQNGQSKQMGQPQPGQPMMMPISVANQNLGQPQMIATNPMSSMQMQNMRVPINQHSSMYSNPQLSQLPSQGVSVQPMSLPSQQMLPGQGGPGQGPIQSFMPPSSQSLPQGPQSQNPPQQQQLPQGQPMSLPNQPMPPQPGQMTMTMIQGQPMHSQSQGMQQGQQMMQQGQQLPHQGQVPSQGQQMPPQSQQMAPPPPGLQIPPPGLQMPPPGLPMPPPGLQMPPPGLQMPPPGLQMPPPGLQMPAQGQQMPPQGQQMPPQGQQMPPQGQQMPPQGQQMPQGPQFQQNQMPQAPNQGLPIQGQQIPPQQMSQGQQMPQGPPMPQNTGQPMKMPPQNFNQQQPLSRTGQTNVKSEHNNNTAELISFD